MTVLNEVGKMPLSVSSDRIALGARTWAETVQNLNLGGRIDVTGTNPPSGLPPVIEVYPAATLAAIYPKSGAVPTADYKSNRTIRKRVLRAMMSDFSINCSRRYVRAILSRGKISEQIDALLAAFTGLVYLNRISGWQVRIPKNVELPAAQAEGWIFFPIRLSSTVAEQT
jgi:hypothetical protein